MSAVPYFPFYPSDYLADTAHLTTEQHGAYLLMLITAWSRGGRLPDDPKKLARIARVSTRRWHLIADDILEFFDAEGSDIISRRMERDYKKAVSKSKKRSASGKRGGDAKALKNKKAPLANATGLLYHSLEPEPDIDTNVSKREARKRAVRLSEEWVLPEKFLTYATGKGMSEERAHAEAEKMRDWSLSSPKGAKLDWFAAWRGWVGRVIEENGNGAGDRNSGPRNATDAKLASSERQLDAWVRAAEIDGPGVGGSGEGSGQPPSVAGRSIGHS